jgi:biotin carboxylase
MSMRRVVLLLPTATYRAADFIAAASALGVEVVVASERRQALARSMGDRALVVNLAQPSRAAQKIVALAKRAGLDAVVAVDDQGVMAAALASETLGLAHNPPEAVARTRDKAAMRAALGSAGVLQPPWAVASAGEDVGLVAESVGFPCVVKPLDMSGSRGVIRADDTAGASAAGARARAIAGEGASLIVEGFVAGAEVAVEGLLRGGALEVLAVFDKPDPLDGPYFEETIYVTPSRLDVQAGIASATSAACKAMGLVEGPVHAELRISAGRIWCIEVAARSIGGLCARSLSFGTGVSLETLILAHALGLPLGDLRREEAASGVMMLPIPASGVLLGVTGREAALAVPGIVGLDLAIPPGRTVVALPEGDRYLGFVVAKATTPSEVESALREAQAALEVRIGPPA